MNADQFKKLIREIVNTELKTALPAILDEYFKNQKQPVVENTTKILKNVVDSSKRITDSRPAPVVAPKTFSTNPILNQILNETTVKIPNDDSNSMMASQQSAPSVLDSPEAVPDSLSGVFTKNYASVLQAADKIAKQKR